MRRMHSKENDERKMVVEFGGGGLRAETKNAILWILHFQGLFTVKCRFWRWVRTGKTLKMQNG